MLAAVPYIVAGAGATLLLMAPMVSAVGILNRMMFKVLPVIIGAMTLLSAALLFVGAN